MQKIFKTQKVIAGIYTVAAVIVFIYTLCFMTEYKDLFGLKLKQNAQISFFHDSILQMFNKQLFTFALIGIVAILFTFVLEIFTRVPDKFALIILELMLIGGCLTSVYAVTNIQAIEVFYRGLDFQYLHLEGVGDYVPRFGTFRVGTGIYIGNFMINALYGIVIGISHFRFLALHRSRVGGMNLE